MTHIGSKQKRLLLATILSLSSALSGCASMVQGLFETVIETTADAVVDLTVDVVLKPMAHAAFDATVGAAIACIDNDKPVLRGALPSPVLNEEYNAIIHVGIRNEPYDNAYDYTFELYGDIPPGIRTENAGRELRLAGTPMQPGEYDFNIRVTVEDSLNGAKDTNGLCFTVDDERFHWSIQRV